MNMKFIKDDIEIGQIIQKILGYTKIGIQDPNHYGISEIDGEYKLGWGHYEVIRNK